MESKYFVHGMHCPACEILINDKLSEVSGITGVKADLNTSTVCINSTTPVSPAELTKVVSSYGYTVSETKEMAIRNDLPTLLKGLGFAMAIFITFLGLQELGIVNFLNPKQITLPFIFFMGIVASLSTCAAVVGSIVLSISANYSKQESYKPLVAFHISRLAGFFVLGGFIGLIGTAFYINPTMYLLISIVLFFVMIIMGLNLLNIFPPIVIPNIKLTKSVSSSALSIKNKKGIIPAVILGTATFILPCGFTQSMQIYSLTTGSFIQSALTMLTFALGTLPVLALISFASVKFKSKVFFTTAGFLVLSFAVFNLIASLRTIGM